MVTKHKVFLVAAVALAAAVALWALMTFDADAGTPGANECLDPENQNYWQEAPEIESVEVSGLTLTVKMKDYDNSNYLDSKDGYVEKFEGFMLRVKDRGGWKTMYYPDATKSRTLTYSPTKNDKRQRYHVQVIACVSSNNPHKPSDPNARWYFNSRQASDIARR